MRPPDCAVTWSRVDDVDADPWRFLTPDERARASSYRLRADRERSISAAALLRIVVGPHTGVAPADVLVRRHCPVCGGPHGRPELPGARLWCSLSHAGDMVCVATSASGPVGVDIEPADTDVWPDVLDAIVAPDDPLARQAIARPLVLWTRKEAVLKATGDGLAVAPADVWVSGGDDPAALVRFTGRPGIDCHLHDLSLVGDYIGAVAVLCRPDVSIREIWHTART